jgi:hypothetical protein
MRIKYVTKQSGKHHSGDLDVDEMMTLNKEEKGLAPKSRNDSFSRFSTLPICRTTAYLIIHAGQDGNIVVI